MGVTRAGRKGHDLQALVINPLIHADCDVGFLQARLRELISIVSLGELPYTVTLEKRERRGVGDQIPRFVQCRRGPARKNAATLDLERVQIRFGDNAPERVAAADEVDNHEVNPAVRVSAAFPVGSRLAGGRHYGPF